MTTISGNSNSRDSDRQVTIQVCGGNSGYSQRRSNYTLSVAYSRLSQTIQRIHRAGGRITGIAMKAGPLATTGLTAPVREEQRTQGSRRSENYAAPTRIAVQPQVLTPEIPEPEVLISPTIPATSPESPTAIPAIPPLSRGSQKRRRSQLPGIVRRKNRKKSRAKAKIYLLG